MAFTVEQAANAVVTSTVEQRCSLRMLCSSKGMASSHSALTASIAPCHDVGDALFPICLGFSLIVMYDATGIGDSMTRWNAGRGSGSCHFSPSFIQWAVFQPMSLDVDWRRTRFCDLVRHLLASLFFFHIPRRQNGHIADQLGSTAPFACSLFDITSFQASM